MGERIPVIRFTLLTNEVPTLEHGVYSTSPSPGHNLPFQSLLTKHPILQPSELLGASHRCLFSTLCFVLNTPEDAPFFHL